MDQDNQLGPETFQSLTDSVVKNTQKISKNAAVLRKYLQNQNGDPETQKNYLSVEAETKKLIKETLPLVHKHSQFQLPPRERLRGDEIKNELRNDYIKSMTSYQVYQRELKASTGAAIEKARTGMSHQHHDSNLVDTSLPSEQEGYDDPLREAQRRQQLQLQMEQEELQLRTIQEREASMRELEANITDVNDIFKNVAQLVHEQGDVIDSIEANIETAALSTEAANVQLTSASSYQKKARRKKVVLILVAIVVIIILTLFFYLIARN